MEKHRTWEQKKGLDNNEAQKGWRTDSGHHWETGTRYRGQTRPTATKRGRRAASATSENKQGWDRKDSGHSERCRAATKIREYRVKSGDRGQSRKQREPAATNNSHREQLKKGSDNNEAKEGWRTDSGHRWEMGTRHRVQTRPTATKRGRRAASATNENKQGWRLGKDSGHGKRRRRAASTIREYGEQLGHTAGLRSFLDHIAQNHMFNRKDGKSFFKSTKLRDIWRLVQKTLTCPDEEGEDKSNKNKLVVKKSFYTPIGVHGFTQANCYTVKVVYDQIKRRLITAYPIHP